MGKVPKLLAQGVGGGVRVGGVILQGTRILPVPEPLAQGVGGGVWGGGVILQGTFPYPHITYFST